MFKASRQVLGYYQSRHQHILTHWIFLFCTTFLFSPRKVSSRHNISSTMSIGYVKVCLSPSIWCCWSSLILLLSKRNQLDSWHLPIVNKRPTYFSYLDSRFIYFTACFTIWVSFVMVSYGKTCCVIDRFKCRMTKYTNDMIYDGVMKIFGTFLSDLVKVFLIKSN